MNKHSILFIGLDTHKNSIKSAILKSIETFNLLFILAEFLLPKWPFKCLFVSLNLNTLTQRYKLSIKPAHEVIGFTD